MITVEPFLPAEAGQPSDPVLRGVTRGLAQILAPTEIHDLPDHIADLVQLLQDRDGAQES